MKETKLFARVAQIHYLRQQVSVQELFISHFRLSLEMNKIDSLASA